MLNKVKVEIDTVDVFLIDVSDMMVSVMYDNGDTREFEICMYDVDSERGDPNDIFTRAEVVKLSWVDGDGVSNNYEGILKLIEGDDERVKNSDDINEDTAHE